MRLKYVVTFSGQFESWPKVDVNSSTTRWLGDSCCIANDASWPGEQFGTTYKFFSTIMSWFIPIPGGLWKVRFLAGGAFSAPLISQKPSIGATNGQRRLIDRSKNYNFYIKYFWVRSILRSPEVIECKMFMKIVTLITFELRKIETKARDFLLPSSRGSYIASFDLQRSTSKLT